MSKKGFVALTFDFRGCGKSDGVFKQQSQKMGIDDARAGLEFLLSQNVDRNRVGIMGSSFGGFVAAILMSEFDFVKSLALRVPAVYPDELLDAHVNDIQAYEYIPRKKWLDSVAYKGIAKFKGGLLIIEAGRDEVVHSWIVKNYYNSAIKAGKRRHHLLKGAEHSLRKNPKAFQEANKITVDWFLKTL